MGAEELKKLEEEIRQVVQGVKSHECRNLIRMAYHLGYIDSIRKQIDDMNDIKVKPIGGEERKQ